MDTLNISTWQPTFGTIEDWNEAFAEVDNYLKAHQLLSAMQRAKIALSILQKVALEGCEVSSEPITSRAIKELMKQRNYWVIKFAEISKETDFIDAHCRVLLYLADIPQKWPHSFMVGIQPPAELIEVIKSSELKSAPQLELSNMVARQIDFGFLPELAGLTMKTFEKMPFLKVIVAWIFFALVMGLLFWYTRG
jgi:hypothetical protein